jgi:hypothetical protein
MIWSCKDKTVDPNVPEVDTGLIVNGDFSSGTTGWTIVNYTSGATSSIVSSEGNDYLKLSHQSGSDWNAIGQEIRSKLVLGSTYKVSMKYKVISPVTSIPLRIRFGDSGLIMHSSAISQNLDGNSVINDGTWHTVEGTFVCGNTTPHATEPMLTVYFDYQASGEVYLDDISVKETTPQITELIENGSFSSGTSGWQIVNFTSGATSSIISSEGNDYLMLTHQSGSDWNAIGQELRSKLVQGSTYRISMKYKVISPVENIPLRIRFGDSALIWHSSTISQNLDGSFVNNDSSWHEVVGTFVCTETLPQASEPMLTVYYDYQAYGSVCLDDISVYKISK